MLRFTELVVAFVLIGVAAVPSSHALPRSVLILDQSSPGLTAFAQITTSLREAAGEARSSLVFYEERLDVNRFQDAAFLPLLRTMIAAKYRDVPIELMIALGPTALQFALTLRTGQFAAVPIVFAA